MSGSLLQYWAMCASGPPLIPPFLSSMVLVGTTAVGVSAQATLQFNRDGSISTGLTTGSASYGGPNRWTNSNQPNPGDGVYIRILPTSGTFTPGSNPAGAFVLLNTTRAISIGPTTAGKNTIFSVEFSYDGINPVLLVPGNEITLEKA